jgi:hypothetical protein
MNVETLGLYTISFVLFLGVRLWHERELGASRVPSAKNHSRTRDEAPVRAFFVFVSKGFSNCDRPSETG